jgi:hypothetical protein
MHEPDFWTNASDAMELRIEGNRLIAQAVGDLSRSVWRRMVQVLDETLRSSGKHQHLPPI